MCPAPPGVGDEADAEAWWDAAVFLSNALIFLTTAKAGIPVLAANRDEFDLEHVRFKWRHQAYSNLVFC